MKLSATIVGVVALLSATVGYAAPTEEYNGLLEDLQSRTIDSLKKAEAESFVASDKRRCSIGRAAVRKDWYALLVPQTSARSTSCFSGAT
jgi:hypothetical protein